MAKNKVQFQKDYSLFEFMQDYGTEEQCEQALLAWLYPQGFMIGNVENSLRGSCHAIASKHLPRHLAEYCYRFNNRFDLRAQLSKLGRNAMRTPPMPYRLLKMAEVYG